MVVEASSLTCVLIIANVSSIASIFNISRGAAKSFSFSITYKGLKMLRGTNDVKIDLSRHRVIFLLPTRVIKLQKSSDVTANTQGSRGINVCGGPPSNTPSSEKVPLATTLQQSTTAIQHLQSSG